MYEFLLKIILTPENIIGLILNLLNILSFCFIFKELGEKWWKSLIPIYSTYIIYKHLWKYKYLFTLEIIFNFINTQCVSIFKKYLIIEIIEVIKKYIKTQILDFDFNFSLLLVCSLCFFISYIIIFIMKRISYFKINKKLNSSLIIIIGTFIIPDIFLLISYLVYKNKKNKYKV